MELKLELKKLNEYSYYEKYKSKLYFLINAFGSVDCTVTCALTEVNESQKSCENAALNMEDCCAVNLRPRTSAQNYPCGDESMRVLITS